ncbi:MAG: lipid-A-disaccharide synthase [Arenicella sp.]|jgi:lipid-A-disaccharide synthase
MKYYLIAGEKSGDLHASNLMKELKLRDENAEFRVWGGDEMQKVGGEIVRHFKETAFMGFAEVIANLPKIYGFIKECKKDILNYKPDVVILVDYAGFNLRIAKFAKNKGFRTFYYISPKVWAWNQKRALKIKKVVDRMFVIMHFEQEFYRKFDYEVDYVGNPLFDAISQFEPNQNFLADNQLSDKPIIAVLPGSRKQEIKNMLSVMLEVRNQFADYQFVVAGVDSIPSELYDSVKEANLPIVFNQTYDLLAHAKSALVTSGTATLETALFNVPQVVCYKTSPISYSIAKRLIKVPYISLVNLIAQKEAVKELIQKDFSVEKVSDELQKTLENPNPIKKDYAEMRAKIETEGTSKRTAELMWGYLNA